MRAASPSMRDRKREESRTHTAETAWRLFIDRGYDHVTVQDICDAADIAPRTFHRYFAAKEDVVAEPVRRMAGLILEHIAAAPAGLSAGDVLTGAVTGLGGFVVENRELLSGLRVVAGRSVHLNAALLGVQPDQEQAAAVLLAQREPGLDPLDWRLRVQVATAIAVLRIWYDDYLRNPAVAEPIALLREMLSTAGL